MENKTRKKMQCVICHEETVWEQQPDGKWVCTRCEVRRRERSGQDS